MTQALLTDRPIAQTPPGDRQVGALTPADLAELMASFNEVTARLQETHEALRGEVSRLNAELADTRTQLHRARELAALGEMAAGIAHEVRNPLGSIRLYASVLADDLSDRPAQREVAQKIAGAVGRLNAIVTDVLVFARELRLAPEACDATELLREAAQSCEDLLTRHSIEVEIQGVRGVTLRADPTLMHQALSNILRNAAEAIAESDDPAGRRRITLRVERRRALDADGRSAPVAALIVRDTGPGVPPEVAARMFNPFYTTRHTGTGLGLAIVHRIVDAHAGRVTVRNEKDRSVGTVRGARVEVILPAPASESAEDREDAA